MRYLRFSSARKGCVRRIYALKRIIHTPKAHGAQEPRCMCYTSRLRVPRNEVMRPKNVIIETPY